MFEWITELIEAIGHIGIGLLMFLENLFPPIPSELIMPLAGFMIEKDRLSFAGVMLAGSMGAYIGAALWYYIGYKIGKTHLKRWATSHGRLLTMSPDDIHRSCDWFYKHGESAVFFSRMIPGLRTFISVPAGIVGMPFYRFSFYTICGILLWNGLLTSLGLALRDNYDAVSDWLDPISFFILISFLALYIYRVITFQANTPSKTVDK